MPVADLVAEAFATGYATVDHPDTQPVPASARAAVLALAAATEAIGDPAAALLVIEAGRRSAAQTANHRARARLYGTHRRRIVTAATDALADVNIRHLAADLRAVADLARRDRAAQATSTLTSAAYGTTGLPNEWLDANTTAWAAATARGRAEAEARPAPGQPPQPAKVTAGMGAAAVAVATAGVLGGRNWIGGQLTRAGWDLAGIELDTDTAEDDLAAYLANPAGIGEAAEDQMHAAYSAGFVSFIAASGVDSLWWQSEEDDRVCPVCQANEDNSPYLVGSDAVPDMPAHPQCRCNWA